MKKRSAEDVLLRKVFLFDKDFPHEYGAAADLVSRSAQSKPNDSEIRYTLGQIVYSYGPAHRTGYVAKAELFEDKLLSAIRSAAEIKESFYELGGIHIQQMFKFFSENEPDFDPLTAVDLVDAMPELLSKLLMGVDHALRNDRQPSGRSRPRIPHLRATAELADAWESMTGKRVLTPKGQSIGRDGKEEATQPSTEFIRLCLKMIDPNIRLPNAMTLIRNIIELKKTSPTFLEGVDNTEGGVNFVVLIEDKSGDTEK